MFKPEYEKKIEACFPSYSEPELKDFIAHSISERILLTLSLNTDEGRNNQRVIMLGVLERLEHQAIIELNNRRV